MGYDIAESEYDLARIEQRITNTDLTPAIEPIRKDIHENLSRLEPCGVKDLGGLRRLLKDKKKLASVSARSGIAEDVLVLLRREIEGWFAEPVKLKDIAWLDPGIVDALARCDIFTSKDAYERLTADHQRGEIGQKSGVEQPVLEYVYQLSSLSRIRWVSPSVARVLIELGYDAEALKQADAGRLAKEIETLNGQQQYYKGKIGERDVARLIREAGYVE